MTLNDLQKMTEGRRLEFKGEIPANSDIAKTAIAFANDAGGEIFIGIEDETKRIVGINEDDFPQMEESARNFHGRHSREGSDSCQGVQGKHTALLSQKRRQDERDLHPCRLKQPKSR